MKPQIIAMDSPDRVGDFACAELRKYLDRSDSDSAAPAKIELFIQQNALNLPSGESPLDGFMLEWAMSSLRIVAARPKGLLNGIYGLIELLGCRFPFPGIERCPEKLDWVNARKSCNENTWNIPSFNHRILHFDNMRLTPEMIDWIGKLRINMIQQPLHVFVKDIGAKLELANMLQDRGIELNVGCHGFDNWLPPKRYAADHPEWYATCHAARRGEFHEANDEKLPAEFATGQLCLSNRKMIAEFSENVISFFREHPEVRTISLWPNDAAGGWCTCRDCLALEPDPDRLDPQTGSPSRSASYLGFIGQVGKIVHAEIHDARIEFAAFSDFSTPPLNTRVVPQEDYFLGFLVDDFFGCLFHGHGESWNRDRIETSHRKWRALFPGEIYAIGYYADLCKVMDIPIVFTTKIRADMAYLKDEIGINSINTLVVCANLDYLLNFSFVNLYSYAALAWNHLRSSESLLNELAAAICPAQRDSVYRYLSTWDQLGESNPDKHGGWVWIEPDEQAKKDSPWSSVIHFLRAGDLIDAATVTKLETFLSKARTHTADDLIAQKILERMSNAFLVFKKMHAFDPDAPVEQRTTDIKQIRELVTPRVFPGGTMALLEKWENPT